MSQFMHIDGSRGEGGGQILRSALTLSILLQQPIRLSGIRAGRAKPGLMRQHLTCVKAAQAISVAEVRGDELRSTEIEFTPRALTGGNHDFSIGTAGSASLVLQTVLPALLRADGESRISIEGGTHNMLAPSTCFLRRCFLPLLRRMGAEVELDVERIGMFPAGGGRIVATVRPGELHPLTLHARGERRAIGADALVACVPAHVAHRELVVIAEHYGLQRAGLGQHDLGSATGPGNVLSLWVEHEHVSELVTVHGERGTSAENVARRACGLLDGYLASDAAVGTHLADQLLLPMWLAGGGSFVCGPVSEHLQTNAGLIEAMTGCEVSVKPRGAGAEVELRVGADRRAAHSGAG
jgi:RNA 3'-terminal phosphate cyclase (ATP)